MLLHAPISRQVFQYFDCHDVGNQFFLRADYKLRCYDLNYYAFLTLVLGVLIGIVIGFPTIMATFLFAYRKKLYSPGIHGKVGWLYSRFRRHREAWEAWSMISRMLLVGAVVLLPADSAVRACMCMVVCVFGIGVLNYFQPYRNPAVFWVDQVGEALALWTYMCSILLNENFDIPTKERERIGTAIIVANLVFWMCGLFAIGTSLVLVVKHVSKKSKLKEHQSSTRRLIATAPTRKTSVKITPQGQQTKEEKQFMDTRNAMNAKLQPTARSSPVAEKRKAKNKRNKEHSKKNWNKQKSIHF